MFNTLVVNYAFEPIQVVDWEKAIYLLVTKKADLLVGYDKLIRSVSMTLQLPKVVRLRKYVKLKLRNRGIFKKRDVFERDNWKCQYCGCEVTPKTAEQEHIIPRSRGGKTNWENITTACTKCNSRKANRTPEEAGMVLISLPRKPSHTAIRPDLQRAYDEYMAGTSG